MVVVATVESGSSGIGGSSSSSGSKLTDYCDAGFRV